MALSKNSNRAVRCALAFGVAALLSGCADYLNNWDSSSSKAGNAHQSNTAIQAIEAWPSSAYKTTVGSGG